MFSPLANFTVASVVDNSTTKVSNESGDIMENNNKENGVVFNPANGEAEQKPFEESSKLGPVELDAGDVSNSAKEDVVKEQAPVRSKGMVVLAPPANDEVENSNLDAAAQAELREVNSGLSSLLNKFSIVGADEVSSPISSDKKENSYINGAPQLCSNKAKSSYIDGGLQDEIDRFFRMGN